MTTKYKIRKIVLEDAEFEPGELISITEAATLLGRSVSAVQTNLGAGRLTCVLPVGAYGRQRVRLLLRAEVEVWLRERALTKAEVAARGEAGWPEKWAEVRDGN